VSGAILSIVKLYVLPPERLLWSMTLAVTTAVPDVYVVLFAPPRSIMPLVHVVSALVVFAVPLGDTAIVFDAASLTPMVVFFIPLLSAAVNVKRTYRRDAPPTIPVAVNATSVQLVWSAEYSSFAVLITGEVPSVL